jgi:hypothetical protein
MAPDHAKGFSTGLSKMCGFEAKRSEKRNYRNEGLLL